MASNISFYGFLRLMLALTWLLASCCWATTEQVIFNFTGGADGGDPASQLVFDNSGNAYGTTVVGGSAGCGTIFQLSNQQGQWQQTVLYSFSCFADGKNPYGGVTFDAEGNLYGTTVAGGSGGICSGDGCGVVYKLTHSNGGWTESVLYSFGDFPDAGGPGSAVIFDRAGNLYGTAPDGGAYAEGAVYQLSPNGGQWTEKVIHKFAGQHGGWFPCDEAEYGVCPGLAVIGGDLIGVTGSGGDSGHECFIG